MIRYRYCPHCGMSLLCIDAEKHMAGCCGRPKEEAAGFVLPESLRRMIEEHVDHGPSCDLFDVDGECDCWLSRFWAEVERLEKEHKR